MRTSLSSEGTRTSRSPTPLTFWVYDHYRFRAIEVARRLKEKGAPQSKKWTGFLHTDDGWQDKASRRLEAISQARRPLVGSS